MSESLDWLAGWYNWPFLFPLAVGDIFILLDLFLGGLSDIIGSITGFDGSVDLDVDADGDIDVDVDADGDADTDADGHGPGWFMAWLGMGKVPISIVFETLFISFGLIGLFINSMWSVTGFWPWLSFLVALIGALIGGFLCTRWLAGLLAKILPSDATTTRPAGWWVGRPGVVINTVTTCSGQIRVEGLGNKPDAILSVKRDNTATPDDIPRDSHVVVMDYIENSNTYIVAPMETEILA